MQLNEAATKAGLEWLQIGANASVLEQMNVEANNQLAQARHEFNIGHYFLPAIACSFSIESFQLMMNTKTSRQQQKKNWL